MCTRAVASSIRRSSGSSRSRRRRKTPPGRSMTAESLAVNIASVMRSFRSWK
jgi:hypothetical protein